ncbi:protein kinase [bacterium]|nr:protein kinase [candidate division CSSED10-310 bacterium]
MSLNYLKEAQRQAQKGNYLDAGDLYRAVGEYEKALEMFAKVKAYGRSAPLLEWLGRIVEAARHFAKAKQFTKSAELFKQIQDNYQAGVMYREAGIPLFAAEMFEKAHAISEAALMFEEAKDYIRAGELYFDRGMYGKAISCFDKILTSEFYADKKDDSGTPVIKIIKLKAAQAYEKLRKYQTAAQYFFECDQPHNAISVCRTAGDLPLAADYCTKAGFLDEASKIYAEMGEIAQSRRLMIQNLLSEDHFSEAAKLADDSGEFVIAAEAYERAGDYSKAGEMYRLTANPSKACDMFIKSGRFLEAAILSEQMGDIKKAAELREKLGEKDKAAELFALINEPEKSARLYLELDQSEEAVRILQNAWAQGNTADQIRNLLGLVFLRRGNFDLAYENYLKHMMEDNVNATNIDIFYELGIAFDERGQSERALKVFERVYAFDLNYKAVKQKINQLSKDVKKNIMRQASTTTPHQFTPGRLVADRYVIKERVGSGGMGVVYRALDQELGIEVALKVLKPKYSHDTEMVQRFKQEVTLARQIHHENVIRLYDFEKVHNVLYISMEFFPSRDLKAIIRSQGALSVDEIIKIHTQVCKGLWDAHRRGIVHRDIKPQNILINDGNIVKLADFGIATVIGPASISTTEFVVGTPEYMSPEQAKGEPPDTRSDIYSLGTIIYESAVGVPPFSNPDSFQVLVDQVEKLPVKPIERKKDLPLWLNDLILKCLEKDPEKRYESVQVIQRQLATCGIADLMLHASSEEDDEEEDNIFF